jgi:predicted amidohydrolase
MILGFVGSGLFGAVTLPCSAGGDSPLRVALSKFSENGHAAAGWTAWAQRPEIQPLCYVDPVKGRPAPDALAISGNGNPIEYGGWAYVVGNISTGNYYQLSAHYRTQGVPDERRQVVVRIDWLDRAGNRVGQPDYAYETSPDAGWTKVLMKVPAPTGAASAKLEFILGWAPQGTVWWDDVLLEETPAPPARPVRIGTISLHPLHVKDTIGAFLEAIDKAATDKPDIVCLGEEILAEGTWLPYVSLAEPIPGPSTERLGERARKYGMYIVAGLTERDGAACYNTAVLIDRHGNVAGKYRKVHLPREEVEGGLTPGSSYPVFDTDFGRIGLMICWDAEYVDAARDMAIQGAEILFVPAAGGYLTLLKARALENHLYIVSSGYDVESSIINPRGEVLFSTMDSGVNKVMAVDLQERLMDPWEGDMRARFHKEYRTDIPIPVLPAQ